MNFRILTIILLAFIYAGCNNHSTHSEEAQTHKQEETNTHNHEGHDHTDDEHNHDHEASSEEVHGEEDDHDHTMEMTGQDEEHDNHNHESSEPAETGDGHNHEEVKIQLTAYSEKFELFAEADPFVVGKTSHILAHFSTLPDFKALDKSSITITFMVNGTEKNQTIKNSNRKGIYGFNIQPEAAGVGKIVFHIDSEKFHDHIEVNDVMVFDDEHDAIHHAEEAEISTVNTAVFTKEQSWKIDFATEKPTVEPFGQIIKTIARVEHAQNDQVLVSAKTNGIVIFLDDDIVEGKSVTNGQVLFSISGKGYADNNSSVRYLEAKNNYEKASSDYERKKELAKDKIVSEKELLDAKNQYENARVIYNNLNDNFDAAGQRVTSSVNGYIMHVYVKNGEHVEPGQPIVSLVKNEKLLLHAEVQQKYAPILGNIGTANIRPSFTTKTYTLEEVNGKILSHGKHTNDDNYLIPVSIQIDNNDRFISGGFVEVYLITINNNKAITIKNSALMEEQGNFFVFVQLTPELFEKREILPGGTDGLKTEILSGISANERIVTRGAILIKLAQATGTLDAHSGHVH